MPSSEKRKRRLTPNCQRRLAPRNQPDQTIAELKSELGVNICEWNSYSVKAGWSLRLKRKARTIVWLGPTPKCFSRGIHSWRKGDASGRRRQAAATDRQDHEGGAEISRRDWCSDLDEIREISAGDQNTGRYQTRQLRESIFGGAHFRRDIAAKALR